MDNPLLDMEDKMYKASHGLWKLLDKLDEDDLNALGSLLMAIPLGDPKSAASYYNGFIQSVLKYKFGVCPTCNIAHDENDHTAFNDVMYSKLSEAVGKDHATEFLDGIKRGRAEKNAKEEDYRPGNYA